MDETVLELKDLSVEIEGKVIFKGLNLKLLNGAMAIIVGPSGVGKTTLLRAIASQIKYTGHVFIKQKVPESRLDYVYITQDPSLWEHLKVIDNVALVRRIRFNESPKQAREKSLLYLEKLGVSELANRYPHSLSGGEQQRVALARGIAAQTDLLLIDEGTSSIDEKLKTSVISNFLGLLKEGHSIVFVTHDYASIDLLMCSARNIAKVDLEKFRGA